jgi:glycosyltransferase involved in cell wall biosynthesis
MRIAQLCTNYYRTAPDSNHGIYYHVGWLTKGLVEMKNDVTLFGSGDSDKAARIISVTQKATREMDLTEDQRKDLQHLLISKCYETAESFDIIHTHLNLQSVFYTKLVDTPTVQSIHSPLDPHTLSILRQFKDNNYISFSLAQRKQAPELNWVANIYHGVDMGRFGFNPHPKDYFLYLGRITEDKGVHLAIEAARAANVPLIIAGHSHHQEGYWHNKIEKLIDGKQIIYVGEANFQTKIEYFQNAKALLLPVQWDEPFGLVMIEAMACGTPVIAWNKGSIPEVVKDRLTGYIVDSVEGMVTAIKSIDKISREAPRERANNFFSIETMVSNYERAYLKVIEQHRAKKSQAKNRLG